VIPGNSKDNFWEMGVSYTDVIIVSHILCNNYMIDFAVAEMSSREPRDSGQFEGQLLGDR